MPVRPPQTLSDNRRSKDIKAGVVAPSIADAINYSPAGVANTKKYIIGSSFSANGSAEARESFDYGSKYGTVGGDIPDRFRDINAKYWTFTDDQKDVVFLNPYVSAEYKENPKTAKANIPTKIYYKQPNLIEGEVWAEYEQKIYVTPDLDWIYENFGKTILQKTTTEVSEILATTARNGGDLQSQITSQTSQLETSKQDFVSKLYSWWQTKIGIITGEAAQSSLKLCGALAVAVGVNDTTEICSPWLVPDTPYVDHIIDSTCPIEQNKNDQTQTNLGVKFPYYSLDSEYNFFIRSYERVLENDEIIDEKILPNMYIFAASFLPEAETGELSDYPKYQDIISLDGLLKDFSPEALKINQSDILEANNLKNPPASSKQYFTYWSNIVGDTIRTTPSKILNIQENVTNKQNFVFYPMQDTDILNNYNDQKFMFPMYNELKFSTGVTNVVGDVMRQTATSNHFMMYYAMTSSPKFRKITNPSINAGAPNNNLMSTSFPFIEVNKTLNLGKSLGSTKVISSEVQTNELQVEITSMDGFLTLLGLPKILFGKYGSTTNFDYTQEEINTIEKFIASSVTTFSANSIFVSKDENEKFLITDASTDMQRQMLSLILYGKIRKLEKNHHRSYGQMMTGQTNHSETIMYIVSKRRVSDDEASISDVIQEYYFLNSSEIDVLSFIDTQVDYDAEYQYDIDSVDLSIGIKYEYKNPQFVTDKFQRFLEDFEGKIRKEPVTDYAEVEKHTKDLGGSGVSPSPPPAENPDGKLYTGNILPLLPPGQESPRAPDADNVFGVPEGFIATGNTPTGAPASIPDTNTDRLQTLGVLDIYEQQQLTDPQLVFDSIFNSTFAPQDIQLVDGNGLTVEITVKYKSDYKLLRTRYASISGRVLDKPPVFPDALITPYKGKNDKLLVTLNQNVGEYFMKPIFVRPEDYERYQKQLVAQKITADDVNANPAIEYKTDDPLGAGGYFEIFRLNKKPTTYYDFQDSLLTTIDGYHELEVGHMESDSGAFRDDIKPNRKYYYMFRVVDVHGHVSNPSPIFEVEMVDDGGTVYLVQNIVQLEEPDIKETGKSLKKYLQVKPTFQQSLLNVPPSRSPTPSAFDYVEGSEEGSIRLGTAQSGVWGKKFKIRITSKSSGKQIDLNVTFNRTDDAQATKGTEGKYYSKPRP